MFIIIIKNITILYLFYIFILEMVLQKVRLAELQEFKKKLEKNLEDELGDDYILDLKKNYDLPDEFKYDIIPEFWNGRNIADFIHAELLLVILYSQQ